MKKRWLAPLSMMFLAACSSGFQTADVLSRSVVPTDPNVGVRNPVRIQPVNKGSEILMGYLQAHNVSVVRNAITQNLVVQADLRLMSSKDELIRQQRAELSGVIDENGSATLWPTNPEGPQDMPVRARVTCLADLDPADCDLAVIDFYAKEDGVIHAAQVEADLRTRDVPKDFSPQQPQGESKPEGLEVKPEVVRPAPAKPAEPAKPTEPAKPSKPEPVKPAEPKPVEAKPEPTKPAEQKPQPKPAEPAKPAQPKPVEQKPEPKPAKPAEPAKPAQPAKPQPQPEAAKPAQPKPAEQKPQPKPAKPAEPAKPVQPKPAPAKPVQPKPAEPKPETQPPKPAEPAKPDSQPVTPEEVKPVPRPRPRPERPAQPTPDTAPAPQEAPAPAEEDDDVEETEGVDSEEQPSLYIGTLYQGADELFEEQKPGETPTPESVPRPRPRPERPAQPEPMPLPTPTPAASRPRDQAIGSANGGSLRNSSSLRERMQQTSSLSSQMRLAHPSRERGFGTFELLEMVQALGRMNSQHLRLGTLLVGDLSQKNGGKMTNSRHKSHQNGLDADLGYPLKGSEQAKSFASLVSGQRVTSNLNLDATWAMFDYVYKSGSMDRIFVDRVIKKALCDHAISKGFLDRNGQGSAKEMLRRLRPEPGHAGHFHLRIRCSVHQPRCRMMGDPPFGSGC